MSDDDERAYLEAVLAQKAKPTLSPAATFGRLAELYLAGKDQVDRAPAALFLARQARELWVHGPDDPLYPKLRHLEAMAIRLTKGDHAEAASIDAEAWQISLEHAPGEAINFAAEWGHWAWEAGLMDEAALAYSNAARAQRRFLLRQAVDPAERLKLQGLTSYASRAAFGLSLQGEHREALKMLERASDMVFSAGADMRAMRRLEQCRPDLAAELQAAMVRKNDFVKPESQKWGLDAFGNLSAAAQAVQSELDAIVFKVRTEPGFETFGLPSGWPDIIQAAKGRVLVYLVPTDKGTLVIALSNRGGPDVVMHPALLPVTTQDLYAAAKAFIQAEFGLNRSDSRSALSALLDYLGSAVLTPVLAIQAAMGLVDAPFTIMPFGIMTYLPLASARLEGGAWLAPGRVRFAYSARNLAEWQGVDDSIPTTAFVVNNPRPLPPEFDPLLLADYEAADISARCQTTVIQGIDARTQPVIEGMAGAGLLHFSCHGTVAREAGYSGVLLLAKSEMLTYQLVRLASGVTARLVVLSACRSGAAGALIEHALSLPAAFLAAGARGVIGSLWHAEEMATLLLVLRFYAVWPDTPADPAYALNMAQHWLRTSQADALRKAAPPAALAARAGQALRDAADDACPYADPWFWAGFFLAGR